MGLKRDLRQRGEAAEAVVVPSQPMAWVSGAAARTVLPGMRLETAPPAAAQVEPEPVETPAPSHELAAAALALAELVEEPEPQPESPPAEVVAQPVVEAPRALAECAAARTVLPGW